MKRLFCCRLSLFAAVVLASAMACPVFAQPNSGMPGAKPLSVEDATALALENNPDLRVLAAEIKAARGQAAAAATWENPEISFAPGVDHVRNPSDTQFHANFGLEQTIEWPGKRALRRAVAERNLTVRELALDGFRSQLAVQVRRACFALLSAREIVGLQRERLTLAQGFAALAKKKVEGGFAPEFEATKADLEVVAAQKAVRAAELGFEDGRVALNALMGRNPADALDMAGALDAGMTLPDRTALAEKALQLNPAIKVQAAEAERAGVNLQSVRKGRLPNFKVGPDVEYMPSEQIIGLSVSLPLPFWDRKKGEIATATAEQEKALAELEKLRREVERDLAAGTQHFHAAKDSLAFFTPGLRDKLKAALDAAGDGYADGHTPLLLYLETQRTYFDAQADYFETLHKLYEARAEIESAAGASWEELSAPANHSK